MRLSQTDRVQPVKEEVDQHHRPFLLTGHEPADGVHPPVRVDGAARQRPQTQSFWFNARSISWPITRSVRAFACSSVAAAAFIDN